MVQEAMFSEGMDAIRGGLQMPRTDDACAHRNKDKKEADEMNVNLEYAVTGGMPA